MNRRQWLRLTGLALAGAGFARAQDNAPSEYEVKAAFLYNFTKFVEWPSNAFASANSPLIIGVLGSDPFGRVLDKTVEGRTANNRDVAIKRFSQARDAREAHVLFISSSERRRLREIIAELGNTPVLTVGEAGDFTEAGGMIAFQLHENKVRFDVLPEAATRAGLKLSSKLLSVAQKVIRDRR